MKKKDSQNSPDQCSNVKEISDGVYINFKGTTSDERDFEEAMEESFKELEKDTMPHTEDKKSPTTKKKLEQ